MSCFSRNVNRYCARIFEQTKWIHFFFEYARLFQYASSNQLGKKNPSVPQKTDIFGERTAMK